MSRKHGRRVPKDLAVSSPTLSELVEATKRIGANPEATVSRNPKRHWEESGYVMVKKVATKHDMLLQIAKHLTMVRGERVGQGKTKT